MAEKNEAEAAEERKKEQLARAELEALAKTTKTVKVAEVGVTLSVPGDVEVEPHGSDAFGTPAMLLSGKASGLYVIVTNAADDRYELPQRIARFRSEFKYGMDIIRQDQGSGGEFELEYSYPEYYTNGRGAGSKLGYFNRENVSGKKVNCLVSGLSDKELRRVIEVCKSLAMAK